jgi:hypothetical protein
LIASLTFSGWVIQQSFKKLDRSKDVAPTIILTTIQSFGGKDEKVLPKDALAKALRDFLFP